MNTEDAVSQAMKLVGKDTLKQIWAGLDDKAQKSCLIDLADELTELVDDANCDLTFGAVKAMEELPSDDVLAKLEYVSVSSEWAKKLRSLARHFDNLDTLRNSLFAEWHNREAKTLPATKAA